MSDLSDRFIAALASTEGGYTQLGDRFLRAWPIIEAELQKRDRLRDQINDAYVRTEAALTEANKLLEQTIEVLEEFPSYSIGVTWWRMRGYPFLDNLKALKKEPDAHQQAVTEMLAPKPIDHVEGGFKP